MKVVFNGMLGYIDWKHQQASPKYKKLSTYNVQSPVVPEATTCIFRDTTGAIVRLETVMKHKDDAPNRRLARKYALRKLLKFTDSVEERKAIWEQFLSLTPKNKL